MAFHCNDLYCFVTPPDDDLLCLICLRVAREPMQHEQCGKLFCRECILRHGEDRPCPNCPVRGSRFYQDGKSKNFYLKKLELPGKRIIQALHVKCNDVSNTASGKELLLCCRNMWRCVSLPSSSLPKMLQSLSRRD